MILWADNNVGILFIQAELPPVISTQPHGGGGAVAVRTRTVWLEDALRQDDELILAIIGGVLPYL